MNLNQVLLSRQCGLSKSFGDYCKSHCPKERQEWGRIKDLYAAVVASDFKMRAFLKSDHNQNAEAGELWTYVTKQGEISSCPGMAWVSSGEICKAVFQVLTEKIIWLSCSKQELKLKRKTTSALILNLSYGAIEKLIFPGRVVTAAKRAICFQLWKSDGPPGSRYSPPSCSSQLFAQNSSFLPFCVTSQKKYSLEEVSWCNISS